MSDFDFTNTEEALQNLRNQLKKSEQVYTLKALSEALGIDFDKLAALIEDGAAEQTEQEEPESASDSDVLAEDLFTAQDPNGLQGTYRAIKLPFGTVITIEGAEFLHTLIDHGDHGHSAWVNTMAELLDDDTVAELARSANGNVTIIHFG
jgi:hypothetical protein